MLQIINNVTQAVVKGELTIAETEKFDEFLKHQHWRIEEAASKKKDEGGRNSAGGKCGIN